MQQCIHLQDLDLELVDTQLSNSSPPVKKHNLTQPLMKEEDPQLLWLNGEDNKFKDPKDLIFLNQFLNKYMTINVKERMYVLLHSYLIFLIQAKLKERNILKSLKLLLENTRRNHLVSYGPKEEINQISNQPLEQMVLDTLLSQQ